MPTLIETPGAADANTYATLVEAKAYIDTRLHNEDWDAATDAQRTSALIDAARLLDASFKWTGTPVTAVQALTWPRNGMLTRNGFPIDPIVIPKELKDAQSELARQLISADRTADDDADKTNLSSVKAGPVEISYQNRSKSSQSIDQRDADIIDRDPENLWRSRIVPDAVVMLLVPSWYVRNLVSRPFLFKVYR